jgi:hypothetical protein
MRNDLAETLYIRLAYNATRSNSVYDKISLLQVRIKFVTYRRPS